MELKNPTDEEFEFKILLNRMYYFDEQEKNIKRHPLGFLIPLEKKQKLALFERIFIPKDFSLSFPDNRNKDNGRIYLDL